MGTRLLQMLIKESLQVFRDKRTRFVLLVPPMIQMVIFGYAATYEIRNVGIAVLDFDNTQESRDLISRFEHSPYFQVDAWPADRRQLEDLVDGGEVSLALHIHHGFARQLRKGVTAPLQVIVDGTNSNTALIALGYVNRIADDFGREYQLERLQQRAPLLAAQVPVIELEHRPWFNADLKSQWFFVPGVIGSLTLIIVVNLTAFAVVREREIGTLEQIMVTPISRLEFILGKTLPFFLVGLADVALVSVVGTLWFGVPLRGSVWVLLLGAVLFLLCMLGIGLFISTVSATQQQSMVTSFFFLMPAITFSGFGFPISSMPEALQQLTYLDPLRYFLVVLRSVYLKGVGLDILWPQMAAMAALGVVMLSVSVFRFQKSMD